MTIEGGLFYWFGASVLIIGLLVLFLMLCDFYFHRRIEQKFRHSIFRKMLGLFEEWQDKNPDWESKLEKNTPYNHRNLYEFIKEWLTGGFNS